MAAANMDNGRHQVAEQRRQAMSEGEYRPVVGHTVTKLVYSESTEDRRSRHAQATGTSRGLWK